MIIEKDIKVGNKYRFISGNIDTIVTITLAPIKNGSGFLEFMGVDENGLQRICFNDELYKL